MVACATGGELTEEELAMLSSGVAQAEQTVAPGATGTAGSTAAPGAAGSGSTIVTGSSAGQATSGGLNTMVPESSQATARPDVTVMGSTEIADAPEEPDTSAGGSTSGLGGGETEGEAGSSSGPGGFFGGSSGGSTTGGSSTPTECDNFDDSDCSTLPPHAVSWCVDILGCANGPACEPSPDDPLCSQPEANETPCTSTIWMSGGYQEQGYSKALEIADAACGN